MKAYMVLGAPEYEWENELEVGERYYTTSYQKASAKLKEVTDAMVLRRAKRFLHEEHCNRHWMKKEMDHLNKLMEFKNSEIGKMIADFCDHATGEDIHTRWKAKYDFQKLRIIKKYIKKTGNKYGITIRYYEDGGETFGPCGNDVFLLEDPHQFYNFGNFDIDDDIKAVRENISSYKKSLRFPFDMPDEDIIKTYIKEHYNSIVDELSDELSDRLVEIEVEE